MGSPDKWKMSPFLGEFKVRDFKQPALVEEVPAHDSGLELDDF